MSSSSSIKNFESILSRQYDYNNSSNTTTTTQPPMITRLIPQEKFIPSVSNHHHHHHSNTIQQSSTTNATNTTTKSINHNDDNDNEIHVIEPLSLSSIDDVLLHDVQQQQKKSSHKTRQIVFDLVTHTSSYQQLVNDPSMNHNHDHDNNHDSIDKQYRNNNTIISPSLSTNIHHKNHNNHHHSILVESKFHEIEFGDWESNIIWDAMTTTTKTQKNHIQHDNNKNTSLKDNQGNITTTNHSNNNNKNTKTTTTVTTNPSTTSPSSASITNKFNPLSLLERKRNHLLDNLILDETTIVYNHNPTALRHKAANVPLILEYGVAGQSVARNIYQNHVLHAQRPTSALRSNAYRNRMDRDWSLHTITSTAELSTSDTAAVVANGTKGTASSTTTGGGTLHVNKDQEAKIIAARQKKRAQMAEDKTSRVAEAMGTMSIGGGRGRTVTSSLMGPGGTERTGRPTRTITSGLHEIQYVEQLDIISNHTLVRNDWSKILLRQFMRPKIPLSVVRDGLSWQFQIRYIPNHNKKKIQSNGRNHTSNTTTSSSSYQTIMIGGSHTPGSISKERIRTEADLSPTEGKLILLEYVEERPPIQLTKGMCSKIVNYYRDSDKTRCPVSAGGGDRPARRKRNTNHTSTTGSNTNDSHGLSDRQQSDSDIKLNRLFHMNGPNRKTTITDWVGTVPKKSLKDRSEQEAIDVLPEGVTEILHPKVHGPFIGGVEEGMTITGLVNNLFVAPMFIHEPETTDFLMILTPPGGASRPGQRESMGVILRDIPTSVYTVGQIEPRTRVQTPGSQGEKSFLNPFVSYLIARIINRAQIREGHGLRFDEIQDRVLPTYGLPANSLRQRLKHVAIFDKTTQIWTTKEIGFEDYIGVDGLAKSLAPEGVAAFESACAACRRLSDLGIDQLTDKGVHTVTSVGITMVYLAGQLNAMREFSRKMKKLFEISKSNKSLQTMQIKYYEKASEELELYFKAMKQKYEVAQYIYEELQIAPWHLTGEYLDVHNKGEGTGMMKLTGLGDPSGLGEGFSFIREADAKPSKSVGAQILNGPDLKKITGTEDDLRKLTMKQMAALLRSYGMAQAKIDTLKRWDRVHVIRDLSTKAASDGIGDGLERFARGEKMKLSEQKQIYSERIKVIWKRQIAALSASGERPLDIVGGDGDAMDQDGTLPGNESQLKTADDKDDSDDDSDDDDDFAAALEDEMADRTEANQLVAAHARLGDNDGGLGQIRNATQDKDLTKDARELAALKRQREEERVAKEGLKGRPEVETANAGIHISDRKVIRRRITKTHPDGRQTTTFKFILHPEEVGQIMAKLQQEPNSNRNRMLNMKYERGIAEKPPGHAMFEDEDDFEFSTRGRLHGVRRKGNNRRSGSGGRNVPRARTLQIGKLKTKQSTEERMKKRKKEEDELDVYVSSAKRKGTSNRRERGSIRDRRAHVVFSDKLEAIRQEVESRPLSGPFTKPVNRKLIPRYYEVISHPIDLATIRSKNADFQYRTADSFLRDFEIMKNNAIKFNGPTNSIALEAIAIYDFVKNEIEANRHEFTLLEEEVDEIMSGKSAKRKVKVNKSKKNSGGAMRNIARIGGMSVDLGDLSRLGGGSDDSDSEDSFELEDNL